jgi:LacI family transcriptional regulator
VEQPVRVMAEAAVKALVGASRGQPSGHQTFPTTLRIRQSCGCAAA